MSVRFALGQARERSPTFDDSCRQVEGLLERQATQPPAAPRTSED